MLLRFDPFRDIDRLANEILGAPRVPQPMPMDCYRHGDTFFLHFDLPGIDIDTLEVTEENNTLTVRAERRAAVPQDAVYRQTTAGDQPAGATTSEPRSTPIGPGGCRHRPKRRPRRDLATHRPSAARTPG
jgi:hypothetical protein